MVNIQVNDEKNRFFPLFLHQKALALEVVYAAFLAHGYDEMTLERLAALLELPLAALVEKYPTKYQLWYAALCQASSDLFDTITIQVNAQEPLEPLVRLHHICLAAVDYGMKNPDAYRFLYMPRSATMPDPDAPAPGVISLRALLQRLAKQCMKTGVFIEQSPEMVSQGIMCILSGTTSLQINIQRIPWQQQLTEHVINTYIAGLKV